MDQRRSHPGWTFWTMVTLTLLALYAVSAIPAGWLATHGEFPLWAISLLDAFYRPLGWLLDRVS